MGCGSNDVSVTQPQAAPSTADAVKAWVESMPTVFAEQSRQAPLEAQQQLDLITQYGLPLSQAIQNIDKSLYPTTAGLQENLASIASEGANAKFMPEWMRKQYLSDINSNMDTNIGSPIAADYASRQMQQQLYNQQQNYQNMALSLAGRQPLTQSQTPQYSNYTSSFTPANVGSYQMTGYNSYMPYLQQYNNQMGMLSMMPSRNERAGQAWGQYLMSR